MADVQTVISDNLKRHYYYKLFYSLSAGHGTVVGGELVGNVTDRVRAHNYAPKRFDEVDFQLFAWL